MDPICAKMGERRRVDDAFIADSRKKEVIDLTDDSPRLKPGCPQPDAAAARKEVIDLTGDLPQLKPGFWPQPNAAAAVKEFIDLTGNSPQLKPGYRPQPNAARAVKEFIDLTGDSPQLKPAPQHAPPEAQPESGPQRAPPEAEPESGAQRAPPEAQPRQAAAAPHPPARRLVPVHTAGATATLGAALEVARQEGVRMSRTLRASYVLGAKLGEGSYGQVFAATCKETGDKVALKRVKCQVAKEKGAGGRGPTGSRKGVKRVKCHVANEEEEEEGSRVPTGGGKGVKRVKCQVAKEEEEEEGSRVPTGSEKGVDATTQREINILACLKHDNVVELREVTWSKSPVWESSAAQFNGFVYLVYDLAVCDVRTLLNHHNCKMNETQVKYIMKQVLEGLAHVHDKGVLHLDLKPENILVSKDGSVQLADFGLALATGEDFASPDYKPQTRDGKEVCTWHYRPPELFLKATKYGPKVDMWSVGCTMAEMLMGMDLFMDNHRTKYHECHQLDRIFRGLGTPTKESWPDARSLPGWNDNIPEYKGSGLEQWINKHGNISPEAVALLEQLLQVNPANRPDARTALKDPWFSNNDCRIWQSSRAPFDLPCRKINGRKRRKVA